MSPLKGFRCICSKAAISRRWLLAGALANSFSSRFARMSVQLMKKFLKGYKFAAADLGATLADSLKFGLGGLNNRKSAFEVLPPASRNSSERVRVSSFWTRFICLTMAEPGEGAPRGGSDESSSGLRNFRGPGALIGGQGCLRRMAHRSVSAVTASLGYRVLA
jgi:hypothetical protein